MFVTVVGLSIQTKTNTRNNNSISRNGTETKSMKKVKQRILIYRTELSSNLNRNDLNNNLELNNGTTNLIKCNHTTTIK